MAAPDFPVFPIFGTHGSIPGITNASARAIADPMVAIRAIPLPKRRLRIVGNGACENRLIRAGHSALVI